MNLHSHMQDVLRTESLPEFASDQWRLKHRLTHAVLGLADEVGELSGPVKAHLYYNRPLDIVNLMEELGDISWYWFLAIDSLGLDPVEVLERNIAKLRARYPEKFTEALANQRDLDKERAVLEGE